MAKRAAEIILRNEYKPTQRVHVNRPFKLGQTVSAKRDKDGSASCVAEMSLLLTCWKQNEYRDSECRPELEGFHKCVRASEMERREAHRASKSGAVQGKNLTSRQVNQLLKKYPLT